MKIYAKISNGVCIDTWYRSDSLPSPGPEWTLVTEAAHAALPKGARRRVSKDTIWNRVKDAIGLQTAAAVVAGFSVEQKIDWDANAWFWSDNVNVLGLIQGLNLDPNVILAEDPYL